jgi:hypothetical protein
MKTLTMTATLLDIISAIQAAHNLFMQEAMLYGSGDTPKPEKECLCYSDRLSSPDDHSHRTRNYYFSLADKLVQSAGLAKNEYCFTAICRYEIPVSMLEATPDELSAYRFTY